MAADYDRISRQFKKSRELPFRTCIEEFVMLQMLYGQEYWQDLLDLAPIIGIECRFAFGESRGEGRE
jgi:hypothetical protein